ncbi:MAG: DUF2147 domain-containing protein [Pseudomonadota bacterium]
MKSLALAGALIAAASLTHADPVHGLWKTQADDNGNYGHVQIGACGETICGALRAAFDSAGNTRASDAIGRAIIWDMVATGEGAYRDGKIYAPDRDRTYSSKMALSGDRLEVSGCVLGICRSQQWERIE